MATAVRVAAATDARGARRRGLVGVSLSAAFMAASTVALFTAPRAIARLYFGFDPADNEAVDLAASLLVIAGTFQIADGLQGVAAAALRGRGIGFRLVLGASSYWLVGVAGGATLAFVFSQGIRGLWWGISLGIACAATLLLAEFLRATARASDGSVP